jgi:hypothetical protein
MVEHWSSESLDTANENPAEPPISDAELTALALKDPPPDDFRESETNQENPLSERSGTPIVWLVAFLVIGLIGVRFLYAPKIQSYEIARQRSPDGIGDAILMEVPQDAAGSHSYRVCMQRPSGIKLAPINCREVAFLGGVSGDSGSQPVTLVWNTSSQLEIRYVNATSIHVYQPVFTWGSARSPARIARSRAILIRVVQAERKGGKLPAEPR